MQTFKVKAKKNHTVTQLVQLPDVPKAYSTAEQDCFVLFVM